MRAETAIRVRVSTTLKTEWQARARADGISLSHALRTAGRLGMILGPARLHESVTAISAIGMICVALTKHTLIGEDAATAGGMESGPFTTDAYYNEYSLMATIEDTLRTTPGTLAPLTANDMYAQPMNAFWK